MNRLSQTSITKINHQEGNMSTFGFSFAVSRKPSLIDSTKTHHYLRTDVSLEKYHDIKILEGKYWFEPLNINPFLIKRADMLDFLIRAEEQLSRCFPESVFILELIEDSEVSEWETLFIKIVNNLHDQSFDERIQKFLSDWLFNESLEIKRLVTIKEVV